MLGRRRYHFAVPSLSGREIVVVLLCAAVIAAVVAAPVYGEGLFVSASKGAARAAPAMIVLGLGALLVGLAAGVAVLDVTGAVLLGAVALGATLINY